MTRATTNPPKLAGAVAGAVLATGGSLRAVSETYAAAIWVAIRQ